MNEETKELERVHEVLKEDVIEKISRGERVGYENVIIKGDLILAEFDLPRDENGRIIVKSEISIKDSKIDGKIDFRGAIFQNSFDISGIIVSGDAFFSGAKFTKEVYFIGSQFNGATSFAGAYFIKRAIFYGARFNKSVSFGNAEFKLEARLDNVWFDFDASFEAARFEFAYFNGAKFYANADFQGTVFERNVEFNKVLFNGNASFVRAKFEENSKFIEAEFHSDVYFNGATFKENADFSRSQFYRSAIFDKETYFNKEIKLDEIRGSRLRLEAKFNEALQGQLSLKNPEISFIIAPWESIKSHLAYDGSAYFSLIRSYNNLEFFDDADNCLYKYRVIRRKTLSPIHKISDYMICGFLGYGVRPQYPLLLGFSIIIISAIIYWLGHQATSYGLEPIELSLTIFFTQTGMDSLTGLCKGISVVESALGVLLIACFVVSLTKWTLR